MESQIGSSLGLWVTGHPRPSRKDDRGAESASEGRDISGDSERSRQSLKVAVKGFRQWKGKVDAPVISG